MDSLPWLSANAAGALKIFVDEARDANEDEEIDILLDEATDIALAINKVLFKMTAAGKIRKGRSTIAGMLALEYMFAGSHAIFSAENEDWQQYATLAQQAAELYVKKDSKNFDMAVR